MVDVKEKIIKGSLSSKKDNCKYEKSTFKQVEIKNEILYQFSFFTKTQVFHENVNQEELISKLEDLLSDCFNQLNVVTNEFIYDFKISKKGKVLKNKYKNKEEMQIALNHNKQKKYILEEGTVVWPLVDLGVMLEDGTIVKRYYDKFKQINKFLEIIDDTIKDDKYLNIVDFGCGKSYLTFILYYYLTHIRRIQFDMLGLDLKEDVIRKCNNIKEKYQYTNLSFSCGDISSYNYSKKVDMVITLHACNTATDYAIYYAINLQAKYIFSAPCCQKEINQQLKKDSFSIINKYGLLKERFSSLLTDSIRANVLELFGYRVNVLEFIELEHSAKNVLIKAVHTNFLKESLKNEIEEILNEYKIKHTLIELLKKNQMY